MTKWKVTTKSGSVYEVDTENHTVTRTPGGGPEELLSNDRTHNYYPGSLKLYPGDPMVYLWTGASLYRRTTTPVVAVEQVA